ncbi:MAG: hypothetical protein QNL80_08900, partial [Akkermansiaceae bacterium]
TRDPGNDRIGSCCGFGGPVPLGGIAKIQNPLNQIQVQKLTQRRECGGRRLKPSVYPILPMFRRECLSERKITTNTLTVQMLVRISIPQRFVFCGLPSFGFIDKTGCDLLPVRDWLLRN